MDARRDLIPNSEGQGRRDTSFDRDALPSTHPYADEASQAPDQLPPKLNKYGGNRGIITTRPSRESIVRSYSEQAAARARNARMMSQKTYHDYQVNTMREQQRRQRREEIRTQSSTMGTVQGEIVPPRTTQRQHMGRAIRPLTSEESRDRIRQSRETYERERASRDALSQNRIMRSPNRQVIDARGSVDSRAFNEFDELVGYSIDDRDRPAPFVDSSASKSRWKSHAGQGFDGTRDRSNAPSRPSARNRGLNLSSLSDSISGKDAYGNPKSGLAGLPVFVKIAVPVIVILLIILLVILFG